MGTWNFFYGGDKTIGGLSDTMKEGLKDTITEALERGGEWIQIAGDAGSGAVEFFVAPGVSFKFASQDAQPEIPHPLGERITTRLT